MRQIIEHLTEERVKTYTKEVTVMELENTNNLSVLYDFSKTHFTNQEFNKIKEDISKSEFDQKLKDLIGGECVNYTEERPVLHYKLRRNIGTNHMTNDNYSKVIDQELSRMKQFEENFNSMRGYTDKPLNRIVNIGIGGSDLGPRFINDALSYYKKRDVQFFSNVDSSDYFRNEIQYKNNECNNISSNSLENTLFIIVSKSFTTIETIENMKLIVEEFKRVNNITKCLTSSSSDDKKIEDFIKLHFVAVTAVESPEIFNIPITRFAMWDFVGGRYSLWSAVGLSIVLGVGFDVFEKLLFGGKQADEHFFNEKLESIPAMMAVTEIYYRKVIDDQKHADIDNEIKYSSYWNNKCIVAYDSHLSLLHKYLQQAEMESNGKNYSGQKIIWGGTGTDVQHSFFQMLHQNDEKIYLEVLLPKECLYDDRNNLVRKHHRLLIANCLAQTRALMVGKELDGNTPDWLKFKGNKPSTTILYTKLTPEVLGFIIATYEHKIFIEGVYWKINSFDQFGVQLGKKLAMEIYENKGEMDESTKNLLKEINY